MSTYVDMIRIWICVYIQQIGAYEFLARDAKCTRFCETLVLRTTWKKTPDEVFPEQADWSWVWLTAPAARVIQEAGHRQLWSNASGVFCPLLKASVQVVNRERETANIDYSNQYLQRLLLLHFYDIPDSINLSTPNI